MLEQASYCYLLSKPPMLHKYGFHLVLSGDRYKKCDQVAISLSYAKRNLFKCCFFWRIGFCLLLFRSSMQFALIEVPCLFIKELRGAISKTMFISILDSKLYGLRCSFSLCIILYANFLFYNVQSFFHTISVIQVVCSSWVIWFGCKSCVGGPGL